MTVGSFDRGGHYRHDIDLQQLSSFVKAAELGSITAAAKVQGLSQPAITGQLAKLENRLGVQLLQRNHAGVKVTPAGRVFLAKTKSLLKEFDDAVGDLARFHDEKRDTVKVGITPQAARLVATPLVERIMRHHPSINLTIEEGHGRSLNRRIASGDLDLALSNIRSDGGTIVNEPAVVQQFHLVGSPSSVRPAGRPIRFSGLNRMRLIQGALDGSSGRREALQKIATQKGIHLAFEVDSPVTARAQLMRAVTASTVSLYFLFAEEIRRGELSARPILDPVLFQVLYLVRKRSPNRRMAESSAHDAIRSIIEGLVRSRTYRWRAPAWLNTVSGGVELI